MQTNITLLDQIRTLQTQLASLTASTPHSNNNRTGSGGGSGSGIGNGGDSSTCRIKNDESYCHTHRRKRNPPHTSVICARKATVHKENATLHNQLGGSTRWRAAQTWQGVTEPPQQNFLKSNKINFFPYSKLINSSVASSYNIFNTHSLPPPPILTAPPPHPLTAPAPNFFYNNQKFKQFKNVSLNNTTLAMITNTTNENMIMKYCLRSLFDDNILLLPSHILSRDDSNIYYFLLLRITLVKIYYHRLRCSGW